MKKERKKEGKVNEKVENNEKKKGGEVRIEEAKARKKGLRERGKEGLFKRKEKG